jgi:hypothetical protein
MMDTLSYVARGVGIGIACVIVDNPETEEAEERIPVRPDSLATELDKGRFSGNRAFTIVVKSDGPITRYGCTSAVSLSEVIDLAGSSLALDRESRFVRKRPMILSTWALMASGVDTVSLLWQPVSHGHRFRNRDVPKHVANEALGPHDNFFQNLLSTILCYVIFRHHTIILGTLASNPNQELLAYLGMNHNIEKKYRKEPF